MRNGLNLARLLCGGLLMACACSYAGAQAAATKAAMPQTQTPAPPAPKMPVTEGVEIDRVVAIVNGTLILDSDVDEERRFTELQPFRDRRNDFSRDRAI